MPRNDEIVVCHYCGKKDKWRHPHMMFDRRKGIFYHTTCLPQDADMIMHLDASIGSLMKGIDVLIEDMVFIDEEDKS